MLSSTVTILFRLYLERDAGHQACPAPEKRFRLRSRDVKAGMLLNASGISSM
jgi:hypothetical protein